MYCTVHSILNLFWPKKTTKKLVSELFFNQKIKGISLHKIFFVIVHSKFGLNFDTATASLSKLCMYVLRKGNLENNIKGTVLGDR